MNWVDIIILIILATGLIKGLTNGFVRGLFGLAALVLGVVIAAGNYERVTEILLSKLEVGPQLQAILGFLAVFVVVLILVSVVGSIISKALKLASLGWLDRLAGGILGLVMACVFTGVVLLLVVMAGFESNTGVARSTVAPTVIGVMDTVVSFAPDAVRETIESNYVKLRVEWEKARLEAPEKDEEGSEETQGLASIATVPVFAGARQEPCSVGVQARGA